MAAVPSPHRVVIVAFPGVQSLDVTGPAEVFAGVTELLGTSSTNDGPTTSPASKSPGYETTIASLNGGIVSTESAVRLDTDSFASLGRRRIDTLVIAGGFSVNQQRDNIEFIDGLRRLINRSGRLVTICTGSYLAAAAGALEGHIVTTHWARSDRLAELHPDITVDADPIFIHSPGVDRDVWSSAGVTAGIDLTLALVERDHSTEIAQTAARWLVMYLRRPGGQTQFATPTWIRQAPPGPIQEAQALIVETPGDDHRVAAIAARVAMSERHFIRRFTSEVGMSPARFVSHVRVDAARHELERSTDTIAVIARRCGFGTAETLRRSLQRQLGVSPEGYRQRFSHHIEPTTKQKEPA